MHLDADLTNFCLSAVVNAAIIEDQLHVGHEVLYFAIFLILQLRLYGREVHWVLHHVGVVWDVEAHVVDRVRKDVGLLVASQSDQNALSCLFPLVKNRGTLRHFWHF